MKLRKLTDASNFIDTLATTPQSWFVTICHVNVLEIVSPKKKEKNPLTNRMRQVVDYDALNQTLNTQDICGIISMTRYYAHNWTTENKMKEKYGKYIEDYNDIRREYGLPATEKRGSYQQTMNYADGVNVGNTKNTQGKLYINQNTWSTQRTRKYYGVNAQGNIVCELQKDQLQDIVKFSTRKGEDMNKLREFIQDEERINQYLQRVKDLKMVYTTFDADKILYMIGTNKDGEGYFCVNDRLGNVIKNTNINPSDFLRIAKETYSEDKTMMQESVNNYKRLIESKQMRRSNKKIQLTESQLRNIITESVKIALKEYL